MTDRRVLLGVTGCIAAYKACEVVRRLQKSDVSVEVVMTESAEEFVGKTTFEALTRKPVRTKMFGDQRDPIPHIRLAENCDVMAIVPCTANVAAKIACGIADDLLTSTALAAHDHLMVAPAMNVHMFESPATQENLKILASRGVQVIEPDDGYQACGDVGKGRLAGVNEIVDRILATLESLDRGDGCGFADGKVAAGSGSDIEERFLTGKKVLVTAGPTVERIDPVRYISNDSSGKMGYAIADAAVRLGAEVTLVSSPVSLDPPDLATTIDVESAEEMLEAAAQAFGECDIAVFAAAVADMRPASQSSTKIKKHKDADAMRSIELVENPDIIATLAANKSESQFVIGFAAETDDVINNAKRKLETKHADMIVANEVGRGKAFGCDEEVAVLITPTKVEELPMMTKKNLAFRILAEAYANIDKLV